MALRVFSYVDFERFVRSGYGHLGDLGQFVHGNQILNSLNLLLHLRNSHMEGRSPLVLRG